MTTFALSAALLAVIRHVSDFHTAPAAKLQPKYRLFALLAEALLTSRPTKILGKMTMILFFLFFFSRRFNLQNSIFKLKQKRLILMLWYLVSAGDSSLRFMQQELNAFMR